MGATNHTKNLNLPQFVGSDKPSWLGDVNNAFADIDKGFGDLKVQTSSVISGQIKALEDLSALHSDAILKLDSDVAVNTASINSMSIDLQVLDADIETVDKREQSHFKTLQDNIDLNNKAVDEIEKDNIYIKKNMDKIEADVVKVSVSIASNNVRVQNLSDKVDTFDGRITTLETDTANTQAQVNVLTNRADNADARLDALEQEDITIKGNIASLDNRVTPLEALPNRVATVEQQATDNAADIVNIKNVNDGQTTAITALQTKTNNITDGVFVPFSFGKDTSGNYGFVLPNGQVQPFFTDAEWQGLVDDITNNMGDIADLQAKVVGIVAGKTLPYSLAIAPGGAYGYIKNGEQGVTAFLTENDVKQIVNLQPIEADVQSLQTDMTAQQAKTTNIMPGMSFKDAYTNSVEFKRSDGSGRVYISPTSPYDGLKLGGESTNRSHEIGLPFSFGIDSNGNYGYYKAGADTVTPFLSPNPFNFNNLKDIVDLTSPIANVNGAIGAPTHVNFGASYSYDLYLPATYCDNHSSDTLDLTFYFVNYTTNLINTILFSIDVADFVNPEIVGGIKYYSSDNLYSYADSNFNDYEGTYILTVGKRTSPTVLNNVMVKGLLKIIKSADDSIDSQFYL